MLYRKISESIKEHLESGSDKIMIIEGARQIGKSYIIREVGRTIFKNFVEINFALDDEGPRIFKDVRGIDDFYLRLGSSFGNTLGNYDDTLIFLDEIQQYPQYLTLLKFLREDKRYHFIASGSLLGIALRKTTSIPIGSILIKKMYQLDFEEFLIADNFSKEAIDGVRRYYNDNKSLPEDLHNFIMDKFKRYLLVGGMPDAVNTYLDTHNIVKVREVQDSIKDLYREDAAKHEKDTNKKLVIMRIYDMIASQMENKKKRIVAKDISGKKGDRFDNYRDEFEYLISAGVAIGCHAISNPHYPLAESAHKNLLKLYLNDVGLLSAQLYHNNITPILDDKRSTNLGAVYETVVAQELLAHEHKLFYYDNRQKGEVDFLIDDFNTSEVLPIEVKSGRDYTIHSALNRFIGNKEYGIGKGIVLCNNREVFSEDGITYMPIYYVMFIDSESIKEIRI